MRLRVKYKQTLTKTKKQIEANKEKKSKGPKISSNYTDISPFKADRADIDLTKLRYGTIDSCDVTSVRLADGTIKLENSWIELILLMLSNVIDNNPDNFITLLSDYEITNQTFCVDKVYGKYNFDEDNQLVVYNIYNTGYYLEANFSNSNIFSAVIGLTKCLGIALNEMVLSIQKKGYNEIELNFDQLEETEIIVNINKLAENLKSGIHMVGIQILGVTTKVHRLDVALVVFCNWMYDNYGYMKMLQLPSYESTGICLENNNEDKSCVAIRGSMISVYTDGNNDGIIRFIKDCMEYLNIDKDQVKFKFRALKEKDKIKEWEVD